jgi:hypothetical protein
VNALRVHVELSMPDGTFCSPTKIAKRNGPALALRLLPGHEFDPDHGTKV